MIKEKINNYLDKKQTQRQDAQADYDATHTNLEVNRPLDTLKTDATEVLGENRGILRSYYSHKADVISQKIVAAEANINHKGIREQYLQFRSNQTRVKIDRIQAKVDNSSNSFLSRQINNQRKQKIAALNRKQKVIASQASKLEGKRTSKPENLQKKIDEYVKKRVDAMYRKALRQEAHRNGIGKHNIVKRAEFMAKLTPDDRKKIAREAILQVRKDNIEKGRLDTGYSVDDTLSTRKVDNYERTIE